MVSLELKTIYLKLYKLLKKCRFTLNNMFLKNNIVTESD